MRDPRETRWRSWGRAAEASENGRPAGMCGNVCVMWRFDGEMKFERQLTSAKHRSIARLTSPSAFLSSALARSSSRPIISTSCWTSAETALRGAASRAASQQVRFSARACSRSSMDACDPGNNSRRTAPCTAPRLRSRRRTVAAAWAARRARSCSRWRTPCESRAPW